MQLGQHLILLLAGHQKPRARMIDHFEQPLWDVSNPRDLAAWRHLVTAESIRHHEMP